MTHSGPDGHGQPAQGATSGPLTWLRTVGRGQKAAATVGFLGATLVLLSLIPAPGPDAGWARDALLTLGSSAVLFAPFYWLTRTIDQHLDRVSLQTTEQVADVRADTARQVAEVRSETEAAATALTGQVDALRDDVDRRLEDVAQRVSERLRAEAAADADAFARLRVDPSRDAVWDAMTRARRLGLLSTRQPPRVRISPNQPFYASVRVDDDDQWSNEAPLQLHLEDRSGMVLEAIEWPEETSLEDVLLHLGRALYARTGEHMDPSAVHIGLADLLEAAASDPERRPAVQLCPPQWMVCDWGVVMYGQSGLYTVAFRRLSELVDHVAEKPATDRGSWDDAVETARSLFPGLTSKDRDPWGCPSGQDPWGAPVGDDPPF